MVGEPVQMAAFNVATEVTVAMVEVNGEKVNSQEVCYCCAALGTSGGKV